MVAFEDAVRKPCTPIDFAKEEVSDFTISYVLMHTARCEEVFQVAKAHLEVNHFSQDGENTFKAIWAAILDCHERYGKLADYALLRASALTIITNLAGAIEGEAAGVDQQLAWAFDKEVNPDEELNPVAAIELLKEILLDRAIGNPVRCAVERAGKHGIYGLQRILEESRTRREEIMAIGAEPSKAEALAHVSGGVRGDAHARGMARR